VFDVEFFSLGEGKGSAMPAMNNTWRHRPECYNFKRNFKLEYYYYYYYYYYVGK
jgi:hypothetical protein